MTKPFKSVEEFCTKPTFDEDGVQVSSGIGLNGQEYPDPVPLEPPVGFVAPPDLMTMIRTMIRSEQFRQAADTLDFETFEESDDFDLDDDPLDPLTEYERVFEPPPEAPPAPGAAPQDAAKPPSPSPAPVPPKAPEPAKEGVASPPPGSPAPSTST